METTTTTTSRDITSHRTALAAVRSYSAAQRRLYGMTLWQLPDGGYDLFPAGYPVPAGSVPRPDLWRRG